MRLPKGTLKKIIFLTIDPKCIAQFRRKALASEDEILAELIGEVRKSTEGGMHILVSSLHFPEVESTSEEHITAKLEHPDCVGTIHSHPNFPWVGLSLQDLNESIMQDEYVSGIFTWGKRKGQRTFTNLTWYSPGRVVVEIK